MRAVWLRNVLGLGGALEERERVGMPADTCTGCVLWWMRACLGGAHFCLWVIHCAVARVAVTRALW